jgi:hypothetical protein
MKSTDHPRPVPFRGLAHRTIIVGDVHGCADEVKDLLDRLAFASDDQLVFVGDLVNKGPDSRGVLRLVRELGARSVLGNHEHRLIAARVARREGQAGPRLNPLQEELVRTFTEEEWAELEALPLKIDLPEHGIRVVHAGVVPGVPFEELDVRTVTRMRSLKPDGTPSDKWGTLWGALWSGPPHVVFGHNARKFPQLHPAATGLDTACVYGGKLTALVLEAGQAPPPPAERKSLLVSVDARKVHEDYGQPLPVG